VVVLTVAAEPLDSAEARRLIGELDAHLAGLYPPEENFLSLPVADIFLIARVDGQAVGCGAVRFIDETTAEVKRMYVAPPARGAGVAWRMLSELEAFARGKGATRLVLETGERQPEAIALYERAGFTLIPCFGEYASSKSSRCFEKLLA
jgi:GNAT superfamily N-acetyltransferase